MAYCFSIIRFLILLRYKTACFYTIGIFLFLFSGIASGEPKEQTPIKSKATPVISLQDLEPKINRSPDILLAVAELEESVNTVDKVEAESGLKAFAGSEVGSFRESWGGDDFREYNQINLKAGLRYPLLGSYFAEQKQILESEYDIKEKEKKQDILLQDTLLLLRREYIAYWAAQEKQILTSAFLDDDQELTNALGYRKEAGLLLEADRLDFMSALALVQRIAQQQIAIQHRALSFLEKITGQSIEQFKAVFPQMKSPCTDAEKISDIIKSAHPKLTSINGKIANQQELIRLTDKTNLEGYVELAGRYGTDVLDSAPGYAVYLNVQFDFPVNYKKASSAQRKIMRNISDQMKQQAFITEASLVMDAHDALQAYYTAQTNIDFARKRLSAAQERIRENLLRLAYLPGDTIEKVQQSRIEALQSSLDLIDALAQKLVQQAILLSYDGTETTSEQLSKEEKTIPRYYPEQSWKEAVKAIIKQDLFHGLTFYVWDTQKILFGSSDSIEWFDNITKSGVKRLLISFTSPQIAFMQNNDQRQSLTRFISNANKHGIRVEWLLGDSSWILPEHLDSLIGLIRSFSDIPFQGIHLDLEPDQLPNADMERQLLLGRLCNTVAAVKNTTTLPVGISIHYRYFLDNADGKLLSSAFEKMLLDEIILMIYITDHKKVSDIAGSILEGYPMLNFSIAQSVEPTLSPAESNYKLNRDDFLSKLAILSKQMKYPNFGSLVVQDMKSFFEMNQ